MRIEDISFLKGNIFALPVNGKAGEELSELLLPTCLVLASQAHNVNSGARDQLETILNVRLQEPHEDTGRTPIECPAAKSGYEYPGPWLCALRAPLLCLHDGY